MGSVATRALIPLEIGLWITAGRDGEYGCRAADNRYAFGLGGDGRWLIDSQNCVIVNDRIGDKGIACNVRQNNSGNDLKLQGAAAGRSDGHAEDPGGGLGDRADGDGRVARVAEVGGVNRAGFHVLAEGHRVGHQGVCRNWFAALVINDVAASQRRRGGVARVKRVTEIGTDHDCPCILRHPATGCVETPGDMGYSIQFQAVKIIPFPYPVPSACVVGDDVSRVRSQGYGRDVVAAGVSSQCVRGEDCRLCDQNPITFAPDAYTVGSQQTITREPGHIVVRGVIQPQPNHSQGLSPRIEPVPVRLVRPLSEDTGSGISAERQGKGSWFC